MGDDSPIKEIPFRFQFTVAEEAIDENGHVNNVVYIQWMQDAAIRHTDTVGGNDAMPENRSWVVRSHKIEYLAPAFEGETIETETWVVDFRKVRSLRRYKFLRASDGLLLARGETDWVFVNTENGRPCAIPEVVSACYPLTPNHK